MLTLYHYPACSTCKKAIAWLKARQIDFQSIDLVQSPPSAKTLASVLQRSGAPIKKLLNTSGQLYREGGYKDRVATLSEKELLVELSQHGKLIKRPLLLGDDFALIGFREAEYEARFGG